MDENEKKAEELIQQAEKKLKGASSGGFLGGLIGGNSSGKIVEGIQLLERAANAYKMAKKWKEAGNTFLRAAEHSSSCKDRNNIESATLYMEASNCFRKVDPLQAVDCIMKATNIYTDMGRFGTAAKHHMTIAEIYETDCIDVEKAIQNYEKAADYFDGEQSNSSTNKCRVKIAHLYAQMGQYDKACKIFEAVGRAGMESKLLQYGAKEYFFKAAICQLCVDAGQAANALQQYQEGFPAFGDSRECKLLQKLIAAIEADEVEAYQSALQDFDGVSRMEPFLTSLFLKIKKARFSDEADIC